jgi:hypothetical protein
VSGQHAPADLPQRGSVAGDVQLAFVEGRLLGNAFAWWPAASW